MISKTEIKMRQAISALDKTFSGRAVVLIVTSKDATEKQEVNFVTNADFTYMRAVLESMVEDWSLIHRDTHGRH